MKISCRIIRVYQRLCAPFLHMLGVQCRYYPSCSQYTYQAFALYPWWNALRRSLCRLWRCQPWYAGGMDPIEMQEPRS